MAASVLVAGEKLPPAQLADDFDEWYSGVEWGWKPKISKPMKSAQRASSMNKERLDITQLTEAGPDSSRLVDSAAIRARAPEGPQTISDSQLSLQTEAPLLQIVPFFEVKRSAKGGYGAFALADLAPHTIILSETALLESTSYDLLDQFELLSTDEKEKFLELASFDKISPDKIVSIFKTNRFETVSGKSGLFPVASRFNHSCKPSCVFWYDRNNQQLVLTTKASVTKGKEITVSYGHTGFNLYYNWGFICDCGHCTPWTIPPEESDHSSNWEPPQDDEWATWDC